MKYQTARLILRPWRLGDARYLKKYAKDPDVSLRAGWPPCTSFSQAVFMIRKAYQPPWCFAIYSREHKEVIGSLSFMTPKNAHIPLSQRELEIGFWIAKPYWGQGLLKEGAQAVLNDFFSRLGIENVWCVCDRTNAQSLRVQEKLGFRYNRQEDITIHSLERVIPSSVSCLSREEWRNL